MGGGRRPLGEGVNDVELRLSSAAGRWALAATVLGSGLAMLDATIVNVALPTIGRDLQAPLSGLQWTVNGYTLSLAALILLGGALGDRFGRRRIFLLGVVWFAVASLLCASAPTVGWLIVARVLQGIGGALLTPGSLALIQASFAPDERARAVGAWSGLSGVAAAVGPFLGGWLIQGPGWRWAFLLNLPVAAVVVAVSLRRVPESRDETASGRFDVLGTAVGALSLTAVTYALIVAAQPGRTGIAVISGALGVGLGVAFVWLQRHERNPVLPLDVFASGQFRAVNVVTLVVYAALAGVFFLLVMQLQVVVGLSALAAGAALLPVTLLMLLLSARAGALAQRVGPRWPMTAGTLLAAVGVLLMSRVDAHASYLRDVLPAAAVFGLGLSATVAPLTATVLATAERRRAGIASGVNNAVARAAQLLAVAALPLLVGLSGDDYLSPTVFTAGFRAAMYLCAGGLLAGSALSLLTIRDDALRQEPERPTIVRPQRQRHCAVDGTPLEPTALEPTATP
jgi:EmrB/QacA subfamily drug resistance transporter